MSRGRGKYGTFSPSEVQLQTAPNGKLQLTQSFTYTVLLKGVKREITAPRGMITDGISYPIFPSAGKGLRAAITHDALYGGSAEYEGPEISREEADLIFKYALRECDVSDLASYVIWAGLRVGGRFNWEGGRA